jgi:hypothetical protein
MASRTLTIGLGLVMALAGQSGALAQSQPQPGVEIESTVPVPRPKFEIIRPEVPGSEPRRTTDSDFYSTFGDPVVNYDPAFIAPFTKETDTGRMGLAGWTSPTGVVDSAVPQHYREPGWLQFGFAVTWGGPPRKPTATPVSAPR